MRHLSAAVCLVWIFVACDGPRVRLPTRAETVGSAPEPRDAASTDASEPSCVEDRDCTEARAPLCSASGACVACRIDDDCIDDEEERLCGAFGVCIECRSDRDCLEPEEPYCDSSRGECFECFDDTGCPLGSLCKDDGECEDEDEDEG